MKYDIEITAEETHVRITFHGTITVTNVMGIQQFLVLDPFYQSTMCAILDLRDVTELEEGGKEVMKMAIHSMANRPIETPAKVAIICTDEKMLRLLNTYASVTKMESVTINQYIDEEAIVSWFTEK